MCSHHTRRICLRQIYIPYLPAQLTVGAPESDLAHNSIPGRESPICHTCTLFRSLIYTVTAVNKPNVNPVKHGLNDQSCKLTYTFGTTRHRFDYGIWYYPINIMGFMLNLFSMFAYTEHNIRYSY